VSKYNVGDTVWLRSWGLISWGSTFQGTIIAIKDGRYMIEHGVNSDIRGHYTTVSWRSEWRIWK
jgi:hypothetical protein